MIYLSGSPFWSSRSINQWSDDQGSPALWCCGLTFYLKSKNFNSISNSLLTFSLLTFNFYLKFIWNSFPNLRFTFPIDWSLRAALVLSSAASLTHWLSRRQCITLLHIFFPLSEYVSLTYPNEALCLWLTMTHYMLCLRLICYYDSSSMVTHYMQWLICYFDSFSILTHSWLDSMTHYFFDDCIWLRLTPFYSFLWFIISTAQIMTRMRLNMTVYDLEVTEHDYLWLGSDWAWLCMTRKWLSMTSFYSFLWFTIWFYDSFLHYDSYRGVTHALLLLVLVLACWLFVELLVVYK